MAKQKFEVASNELNEVKQLAEATQRERDSARSDRSTLQMKLEVCEGKLGMTQKQLQEN
jgi:hypothetical protein